MGDIFDRLANGEERLTVPVEVINGMRAAESSNDPNATGPVTKFGWQAKGLMQLSPDIQKQYGVTDPYDAFQNERAGTAYINDLYNQYGDIDKALAHYVGGSKYISNDPNWLANASPTVQNYVKRAKGGDMFDRLGRILDSLPAPGAETPTAPQGDVFDRLAANRDVFDRLAEENAKPSFMDSVKEVWTQPPETATSAKQWFTETAPRSTLQMLKGFVEFPFALGHSLLNPLMQTIIPPAQPDWDLNEQNPVQLIQSMGKKWGEGMGLYNPMTDTWVGGQPIKNFDPTGLEFQLNPQGTKEQILANLAHNYGTDPVGSALGGPVTTLGLMAPTLPRVPKSQTVVTPPPRGVPTITDFANADMYGKFAETGVPAELTAPPSPPRTGITTPFGEGIPANVGRMPSVVANETQPSLVTDVVNKIIDRQQLNPAELDFVRRNKLAVQNDLAERIVNPSEPLLNVTDLNKYEAYVKGGSTRPAPAYAGDSTINMRYFNDTNDVMNFLSQTVKDAGIEKGRSVPWTKADEWYEKSGYGLEDLIKDAKKSKAFNTNQINAMRRILASASHEAYESLMNLPADPKLRTPEMKAQVLDNLNNLIEVARIVQSRGSEQGRGLNMMKKIQEADPNFLADTNMRKAMKTIFETRGNKKMVDKILDEARSVDWRDPAAVKKFINTWARAPIPDMIFEGWMNGLVSFPPTHAANIIGNTAAMLTKVPEHMLSAALQGRNPLGEGMAESFGMVRGTIEGARAFVKAFKTGEASELWAKVDVGKRPAIPGKTGEIVRLPTRFLTAEDEFAKAVIYRSEMNRMAWIEAKKEGLTGKNFHNKVGELLANPTSDMLDAAHAEALYRTFNKPLGRLGNTIMHARELGTIPSEAFKYVAPFIRTPTNLFKYAIERTPLAFGKIAVDLVRGGLRGAELADAVSRAVIGSVVQTAVVYTALQGYITGGGPKEPGKRDALYATGWQPYSFKDPRTGAYHPYSRFDPWGMVIGPAADFAEMLQMEKKGAKTKDLFTKMILSLVKNLPMKTWMAGVNRLFDTVFEADTRGEKGVQNIVGSAVPNVVAGTVRSFDKKIYENQDSIDALKQRVGATGNMFPKRDIWGRPIERPGSTLENLVSPSVTSPVKGDKIDREIVRLDMNIGRPQKKIRGVELTPAEYDEYCRRAGEMAHSLVEKQMNTRGWDLKRDEIKALTIHTIVEQSRTKIGAEMWKQMEHKRKWEPINKKYGVHK